MNNSSNNNNNFNNETKENQKNKMVFGVEFSPEEFWKWLSSKGLKKIKYFKDTASLVSINAFFHLYQGEDIRLYLVQEDKLLGVWLDIDKSTEEEAKDVLEKIPVAPTYFVHTGRHYAGLWELEDGKAEDYKELTSLLLRWVDDLQIVQEMKAKTEKNAMIRVPGSINTKTGRKVKWFKVGEIYTKEEFISALTKTNPHLPVEYCRLSQVLWANFDKIKYNGWRLLSYFALLKEEILDEFINKSEEWEKTNPSKVQQTTEQRLRFSKKELEEKRASFYSCYTIANMSLSELQIDFANIDFISHPCFQCKFKNSRLKPFFQNYKIKFSNDDYKIEGNIVKKGNKIIAENFDIQHIIIEKLPFKIKYYIFTNDYELDLDDDKELQKVFRLEGNLTSFRKFLLKFIDENRHLVEERLSFTGYENEKWNIYKKDYFFPVVHPKWDCSSSGDVNVFIWNWKKLLKIIIEEQDIAFQLGIGYALRFLKQDYNLAPVLLFVGKAGAGKSLRMKIINSLVRVPDTFNFADLTSAFITNFLTKIKGFLIFDEFMYKQEIPQHQALLSLINFSAHLTTTGQHLQNSSPILLSGEQRNLRAFDRTFARRIFTFPVQSFNEKYGEILDELKENYGFLYLFSSSLKEAIQKTKPPLLPPEFFTYPEHHQNVVKAIAIFKAFCSIFEIPYEYNYDLYLRELSKENIRETILIPEILEVLKYIREEFTFYKRKSVYFSEIEKQFGKKPDIFKLVLCDEWSKTKGGGGKYYPSFRITTNSPLVRTYIFNEFVSKSEFEQHIKLLINKLKNELDFTFKYENEDLELVIDYFFSDVEKRGEVIEEEFFN